MTPAPRSGCAAYGLAPLVLALFGFALFLFLGEPAHVLERVASGVLAGALACFFVALFASAMRSAFPDPRQRPEEEAWTEWAETPAHGPYGPVRIPLDSLPMDSPPLDA